MTVLLLILHSLVAVALLGALVHQAVALVWPGRKGAHFTSRYRAVNSASYTSAVMVLYVGTVLLGAVLYPAYRLEVRLVLEGMGIRVPTGLFEIKEHFAALGLGALPAYFYFWTHQKSHKGRTALTLFLAASVLFDFVIGHVLNNIRGFGP